MTSTQNPIYLDYHSTTPVDPRVAEHIHYYLTTDYGNASSLDHVFGDKAAAAVEQARTSVASLLGSECRDVIFTSGATESINLAIKGLRAEFESVEKQKPLQIGLLPVEHLAVIDCCEELASFGRAELTYFNIDGRAQLDLDHFESICKSGIDLACIMAANNEVGTIYPIQEITNIAHRYGALILSDATQAAGKINIEFSNWDIDLLALSAHKLYGPKGVGALLVAPGVKLHPQIRGGNHQRGIRSGTLNVPGIVGLSEACRLREAEMFLDEQRVAHQRDRLQTLLQANIPSIIINGDLENRLSGNLHISIPGIPNQAIVSRVRSSLAISTGAACSTGIEVASHVLRAMRLSEELVDGALRLGLGKFTTDEEINRTSDILTVAVRAIQQI